MQNNLKLQQFKELQLNSKIVEKVESFIFLSSIAPGSSEDIKKNWSSHCGFWSAQT